MQEKSAPEAILGPMTRRAWLAALAVAPMSAADPMEEVEALTFDVFGTVVDWRSTIIREGRALAERLAAAREGDWARFADDWRAGYGPAMRRVRAGELPWTIIDDLHRMILDEILPRHGLEFLTEGERAELNRVWHRLEPWPDAVAGLTRLKKKYVLATLSNGNVALLVNMAKHGGLPWDAVLSAELAGTYKPDPEVYRTAARLLGRDPERVMMVAAHPGDLRAAAAVGFRTGYVRRPDEHGPGVDRDRLDAGDQFDVTAEDFLGLADRLGA